jgi:hypothetical protein
LWLVTVEADLQFTALRCDAEVAVAQSTDEIKRLLRRLLVRQSQRVVRHARFHGCTHLWRCTKESVRWHQARERLMRPLEIIAVHI